MSKPSPQQNSEHQCLEGQNSERKNSKQKWSGRGGHHGILVLASASPRRLELLRQIGFDPLVRPADVDETLRDNEAPDDYVRRIAQDKVRALIQSDLSAVVIGADTTVVCDGEVLGKPGDETDAARMLQRLSGREHEVWTGVCVGRGDNLICREVVSSVRFRPLLPAEIQSYIASGEPMDKAGAYAIQGLGAIFVAHLEGSYSAVMGLPLCETAMMLAEFDCFPMV